MKSGRSRALGSKFAREAGANAKTDSAKKEAGAKANPLGAMAEGTSSKGGILQKARQKLGAVYMRLPVVPFLGRGASAILYATALLYLIFTAYVFIATPNMEPQVELLESALSKNAPLQLQPGEKYEYAVSYSQDEAKVYYSVGSAQKCPGAEVIEKSGASQSSRCILPSGNLAEAGFENVNSGLGNSSILLFSPWMLAASENFSWQITNRISAGGMQIDMPVVFRSLGMKRVAGRDAYEILVQGENEQASKIYVDAEKRVALLLETGGASARLVSAPFALDRGNGSSQD